MVSGLNASINKHNHNIIDISYRKKQERNQVGVILDPRANRNPLIELLFYNIRELKRIAAGATRRVFGGDRKNFKKEKQMKKMWVAVMFIFCIGWVQASVAEDIAIKAGDTLQTVLEVQKGKKITVRLLGGEELTGRVKTVSKDLLQLGELSGKEYFDAIIDVNKISAMIVRTKE